MARKQTSIITKSVVFFLYLCSPVLFFLNLAYCLFCIPKYDKSARVPIGMLEAVERVDKKSKNDRDFLKKMLIFVSKRYKSVFFGYIFNPRELLMKDVNKCWQRKNNYLPCDKQVQVLETALLSSGKFRQKDVKKVVVIGHAPHVYLKVRIGEDWVALDPWAIYQGLEFGEFFKPFIGLKLRG